MQKKIHPEQNINVFNNDKIAFLVFPAASGYNTGEKGPLWTPFYLTFIFSSALLPLSH